MNSIFRTKVTALWKTLVLIFVVWTCIRGCKIENYQDEKVSGGTIWKPWYLIAAHIENPQYLTVRGKTFHGVRGLPPYYLDVPGTNLILFVTQEANYQIALHIFSLDTAEDLRIEGVSPGFGWGIGGDRKPGHQFTDYIESIGSNRMTIIQNGLGWKEKTILNLHTKAVEQSETLELDSRGNITNRLLKEMNSKRQP